MHLLGRHRWQHLHWRYSNKPCYSRWLTSELAILLLKKPHACKVVNLLETHKTRLSINVNNFLLARILILAFVPILQRNKYAYISTRLFSKDVNWNGTSLSHAMYCPNSNWILVTKIDLLIVVSRLFNYLWLHMQATTINLALALKKSYKKWFPIKALPNRGNIFCNVLCKQQQWSLSHLLAGMMQMIPCW